MKTIDEILKEYDVKFGIGSLHVLSNYTYAELQSFLKSSLLKVAEESRKEIFDGLPLCPKCKNGINCLNYGGNIDCFHCSTCPYTECEE